MFGLHFVKTEKISKHLGKFYTDIFDMKQIADYRDFVEYSKQDVLDVLKPANELIVSIETLLNEEK